MQNNETKTLSMPRLAWAIVERVGLSKGIDRSKAAHGLIMTAARRSKDEEVTKLIKAIDSRSV